MKTKTIRRLLLAGFCLAAATAANAQPPYSDAEEHVLRLLAPLPMANPTEVTVAAAEAATRARPRDADAWNQLGQSLDVAGHHAEAATAFERATRLPPRLLGRAYLYRDLAEAREKVGDYAGGIAAMRVAFRSWPLSRDGRQCGGFEVHLLTRLLVKAHDLEGALAFFGPIHRASPRAPECFNIRQALEAARG